MDADEGATSLVTEYGADHLSAQDIHSHFCNTEYARSIAGKSRYGRYRPEGMDDAQWIALLGPEVDLLEHMPAVYNIAEDFLGQCANTPADQFEPIAKFSEGEEKLILLTAVTHNWGKAITGDMDYESRSKTYDRELTAAYQKVFLEVFGVDGEALLHQVLSVMHAEGQKLNMAFNAIKRISWSAVALRAFEQSQSTDDKLLHTRLQWMCAGILANHVQALLAYAAVYPPVATFLQENAKTISEAYDNIGAETFALNGQGEFEKKKDYLTSREHWRRFVGTAGSEKGERRVRSILEFVEDRTEQLDPKYLEALIIAENELKLVGTVEFEELTDRLRRITFRGIYDSTGRPLHPYADARFRLATVHPQNSMAGSPTVHVGTSDEYLWTPQPTIYANQTEVIRAVDFFLRTQGRRIAVMDEAVEYEWAGRGRFHVLPPIVEQQTLPLVDGYLDLEALSECFRGAFVKDDRGRLHELSARYLDDFYIDSTQSLNHFDVFHPNLQLLNYGKRYTGQRQFNIICDGAHRVDYAIEDQDDTIAVIIVEPSGDKPLLPYYAMPMPFRPTLRLSSKRAERMFAHLERDKFHLLTDDLRKTLHYDWAAAGLNVSSLRTKTEIN